MTWAGGKKFKKKTNEEEEEEETNKTGPVPQKKTHSHRRLQGATWRQAGEPERHHRAVRHITPLCERLSAAKRHESARAPGIMADETVSPDGSSRGVGAQRPGSGSGRRRQVRGVLEERHRPAAEAPRPEPARHVPGPDPLLYDPQVQV